MFPHRCSPLGVSAPQKQTWRTGAGLNSGLPLFWNFWNPGKVGDSAKVREKAPSQGKVRKFECGSSTILVTKLWCELCMNCDVHGHVLRSSYNLPVLYLYCTSFFHAWCSWRIWINKCAFVWHCLQFRLEKSVIFFCLENDNPEIPKFLSQMHTWYNMEIGNNYFI